MKTPEEKYAHDLEYRQLVDLLEHFIHQAKFTPSELREACIFAHIRYSSYNLRPMQFMLKNEEGVVEALESINRFVKENSQK